MIYRFDSLIFLKMIIREGPVKREMMKKKIKKKEGIKRISLKKIKTKIRNRIKDNLMNLVGKKSSTLIISLSDFARRASTINI